MLRQYVACFLLIESESLNHLRNQFKKKTLLKKTLLFLK